MKKQYYVPTALYFLHNMLFYKYFVPNGTVPSGLNIYRNKYTPAFYKSRRDVINIGVLLSLYFYKDSNDKILEKFSQYKCFRTSLRLSW